MAQTVAPRWIIVSASSIEPGGSAAAELDRLAAAAWPFELRILRTTEFAYASRNRNRAAAEAIYLGATLLSFFDSDDLAYPRRLEAILAAFEISSADVVLHGFLEGRPGIEPPWPPHPVAPEILEDAYRIVHGYLQSPVTGQQESLVRPLFTTEEGGQVEITSGHVSIRASPFQAGIRFREDAYGYEDSAFVADLVLSGYELVLLPYPYSYYASASDAEQNQKWAWILKQLHKDFNGEGISKVE